MSYRPEAAFSPSSVTTEASGFLRSAIAGGLWAPGTRIPELDVAAQLGISRTPLREALRTLSAEGLVEAVHGTGYIVRTYEPSELDDVYQARCFFEGEAAYRAATLMEDSELWRLESCVTEGRRLDEHRTETDTETLGVLTQAHAKFHALILEGSRSAVFRQIVSQLMVRPLVYRGYYWYTPEERRQSRQYHADILAALMDRNGDRARSLMIEHTTQIAQIVLSRAFPSAPQAPGETDGSPTSQRRRGAASRRRNPPQTEPSSPNDPSESAGRKEERCL